MFYSVFRISFLLALIYLIIRERADDEDRTTLAVTCDGDIPDYSRGSSCATATFSGMAALAWSYLEKDGDEATAEQVELLLLLGSSNGTQPSFHPDFGAGWVDLDKVIK